MTIGPSARSRSPHLLPRRDRRRRARRAWISACSVAVVGAVALVGLVGAGTPAASTPAFGADIVRAGLRAPSLDAPLSPFRAVRLFDRPATPWAAGHRGIDLPAVPGEEVTSPGRGVVTFAGVVVDRGVVTVDHGGGLLSSIEPIAASVAVGDAVDTGDPLGVATGERGHCAPRTCVHWGVRVWGEYVNPLDILAGYGRIVLLP